MLNNRTIVRKNDGFSLFWDLTVGNVTPSPSWLERKNRLKFMLRTLFYFRSSIQYLNEISNLKNIEGILSNQPSLPIKIHRPYLTKNFPMSSRITTIVNHYKICEEILPPEMFDLYTVGDSVNLYKCDDPESHSFSIDLLSIDNLNKEGEMTILLRDFDGEPLAKLTFSFIKIDNELCFFVGGIQGTKLDGSYDRIKNITKACHGTFPKKMLIESLVFLGKQLEIKNILMAGNKSHIYNNWRYRKRLKFMHADYDELWQSIGATEKADVYTTPCFIPRKSLSDIPSKKRSEYRKRFQLLDSIEEAIALHFEKDGNDQREQGGTCYSLYDKHEA
ncbi:VirK/YbjX family protein [Pectobacterium aroidearum]|uniref:VirK/YbjX family protein n=1 Tax=Pectobacterium aroidearum TaxID=1201031 RepID=UPI0032F05F7E